MTCVICFEIYVNHKEVPFVKIGMSKHSLPVSPYKINSLLGIIMALSMYFKILMLKKYISSERIDMMFEHLLKSPLEFISKRCKNE